ncbi:hypothetical protein T03_13132 [Trichinella britovi]|uniref:Uncharacterized protein n=1 Tax=Trichinella britovi TaxID=45882 RepID=A0A0V1CVG9_TRIBR|nr:hypothetical protein T03_13132 [Trichinella britovi]
MYNTILFYSQSETLRINFTLILGIILSNQLAVNGYGSFLKICKCLELFRNNRIFISSFCLKLPKKHIDQFNVAVHAKSNEFASANGIKEN